MHIEHDIEHFVRMLNMETSEGKREWETQAKPGRERT